MLLDEHTHAHSCVCVYCRRPHTVAAHRPLVDSGRELVPPSLSLSPARSGGWRALRHRKERKKEKPFCHHHLDIDYRLAWRIQSRSQEDSHFALFGPYPFQTDIGPRRTVTGFSTIDISTRCTQSPDRPPSRPQTSKAPPKKETQLSLDHTHVALPHIRTHICWTFTPRQAAHSAFVPEKSVELASKRCRWLRGRPGDEKESWSKRPTTYIHDIYLFI